MNPKGFRDLRENALRRAENHSPFLREAISAHPSLVDEFLAHGAPDAANIALSVTAEELEVKLRRRRRALALAVALGDLSGELADISAETTAAACDDCDLCL